MGCQKGVHREKNNFSRCIFGVKKRRHEVGKKKKKILRDGKKKLHKKIKKTWEYTPTGGEGGLPDPSRRVCLSDSRGNARRGNFSERPRHVFHRKETCRPGGKSRRGNQCSDYTNWANVV